MSRDKTERDRQLSHLHDAGHAAKRIRLLLDRIHQFNLRIEEDREEIREHEATIAKAFPKALPLLVPES